MVVRYRFQKERLLDGTVVCRPQLLVKFTGTTGTATVKALLDSGCDATVIPTRLARFLGITTGKERTTLTGFRETSLAYKGKANITFVARVQRLSEHVNNVPVLIVDNDNSDDVVLGVEGIFDAFAITFAKPQNRIVLKRAVQV